MSNLRDPFAEGSSPPAPPPAPRPAATVRSALVSRSIVSTSPRLNVVLLGLVVSAD